MHFCCAESFLCPTTRPHSLILLLAIVYCLFTKITDYGLFLSCFSSSPVCWFGASSFLLSGLEVSFAPPASARSFALQTFQWALRFINRTCDWIRRARSFSTFQFILSGNSRAGPFCWSLAISRTSQKYKLALNRLLAKGARVQQFNLTSSLSPSLSTYTTMSISSIKRINIQLENFLWTQRSTEFHLEEDWITNNNPPVLRNSKYCRTRVGQTEMVSKSLH